VNRLCQAAGVSRAGYYRFRRRHESKPADMTLRNQIQHIALRWPAYGYRRVHAELIRQGWKINHQRVLGLMRSDNLLCVRRRKFLFTTDSRHGLPIISQPSRGPGRHQHRPVVGTRVFHNSPKGDFKTGCLLSAFFAACL